MAEITYSYNKIRREFGRKPEFHDAEPEVVFDIHGDPALKRAFMHQSPYETEVQCVAEVSEAATNTEQVMFKSQGMYHVEGGWPAGVDPADIENTIKYVKKVEREEGYIDACRALLGPTERMIKDNNAIDIYEQYFADDPFDHEIQTPSAKVVTVLADQSPVKRTASHLSWNHDCTKLAVAYCPTKFQAPIDGMALESYIWDVNKPITPELALKPSSHIYCLEYHTKDQHLLAGGSRCGTVQYWDTRQPRHIAGRSSIKHSHNDPVFDLRWLSSKTGELLTVSTDGKALVWDIKKMDKPIAHDTAHLQARPSEGTGAKWLLGGVSLDYDPLVGGPSRYLVGTEQGSILVCNRRGKTPDDKVLNVFQGHHGPVYSVMRNSFFPKYFLSVGDWTARIWCDDIKTTMLMTPYSKLYLTSASWHPLRPAVFLTTRMDGLLEVWDLLYSHSGPLYQIHVSDGALHTHKCHPEGHLVALGGADGLTSLVQMSRGLAEAARDEKALTGVLLEREAALDRNSIQSARQLKMKQQKTIEPLRAERDIGKIDEQTLRNVTRRFMKEVSDRQAIAAARSEERRASQSKLPKDVLHPRPPPHRKGSAEHPNPGPHRAWVTEGPMQGGQ